MSSSALPIASLVAAAAIGFTFPHLTPARAAEPARTPAVSTDPLPSSPPPAVRDAIATASARCRQLAEAGRSIRFTVDPLSGRASARLADDFGTTLARLSGAEVLALAAGTSTE